MPPFSLLLFSLLLLFFVPFIHSYACMVRFRNSLLIISDSIGFSK